MFFDERLLQLVLKMPLLADVLEKSRNNSFKIMDYMRLIISMHQIKVGMQCSIWQKLSLNLYQMLTFICSLIKTWEVQFLTFLKDTVKPAISI